MSFPQYTFNARGGAIHITQEGYPEGVFDIEGLWREYRIAALKPDPNRLYVIERAIERLQENKAPKYRMTGSIVSQARRAAPRVYLRGPRKVSLLRRIWNRIFGL